MPLKATVMPDRNREPNEHYIPVELTRSAEKKLPEALKARRKRDAKGALGKAKHGRSRANAALAAAKKSQGR